MTNFTGRLTGFLTTLNVCVERGEYDPTYVCRKALSLAREVADETGTLMAGNICNTGAFDPNKPESVEKARLVNKVPVL